MFERYTEKARRVIFFARYEASTFGSPYIETEHLLLGLLREDKALTHRLLSPYNAVEHIRREIDRAAVPREKISTSVDLPLSNECKRVLAYANEESEHFGHRFIGCEHLATGLLREERSFAAKLLHDHGVTLATAREDLQKHDPSANPAAPPRRQPPLFGIPRPALKVTDLSTSAAFYTKIGFRLVYGQEPDPIRLLSSGTGILVLYAESLGRDLVCFTGGELSPILERVEAGELTLEHPLSAHGVSSPHLLLRDPDAHLILLISPDIRAL